MIFIRKIIFSISLLFLVIFLLLVIFLRTKIDVSIISGNKYGCEFVRTYSVYAVYESNDNDYLYVTIRGFQDEEIQTIKVSKTVSNEIIIGNSYEFKFIQRNNISDDNILNIYNNSDLISIKRTDKVGLEQINENYCN